MNETTELNPKNRGLGRGLDALFENEKGVYPQVDEQGQTPGIQRKLVNIEQLTPNPHQPRKIFNDTALQELASSIKEYGILQPLLVRPNPNKDGNYEIIAGERRWRASQLAQIHEIPVVIKEFSDSEALQIGLVENLQREDLNPMEESIGYQQLIEQFGHTQKKVAELVGKSRSQITNMLRLLNLPKSIQSMVENNRLSVGHARALIGKENAEDLAKEIVEKDMSVRDIENITSVSNNKESLNRKKVEKDTDTRALEKEISDNLGMKVDISLKKSGQTGSVKILFKSLDQLDYLLHQLSKN